MTMPDAIAAERLEAAQQEWARHDRERRVVAAELRLAIGAMATAVQHARGVLAHLERGDWIKSPQQMAAERAAEETRATIA